MNTEPKLYHEEEYLDAEGEPKVPEGTPTHFCLTAQIKKPGMRWDPETCQEANFEGELEFEAYDYQGNEAAFQAARHCAEQLAKAWKGRDVRVSFDNFDLEDGLLDGGYIVVRADGRTYRRAHR